MSGKAALLLATGLLWMPPAAAEVTSAHEISAQDLIRNAMEHWRGLTSQSVMTMTIHRPDWERSMTMESWSKGEKLTLVRVIEPKRDGPCPVAEDEVVPIGTQQDDLATALIVDADERAESGRARPGDRGDSQWQTAEDERPNGIGIRKPV